MTTTRHNGTTDLEARLEGFGKLGKLGLLKLAGALATDDRLTALNVGLSIGNLPTSSGVTDDLVAAALDSLASLATVQAAQLRGEEALR